MGDPLFGELCAQIALRTMDTHWVAHLADMEGLKAGIGLRAYGHRDPLVEYKEEAYRAFSRLVGSIYEDSLRAILRLPAGASMLARAGSPTRTTPSAPRAWCTPTPGRPPKSHRSTRPTPRAGARWGSCLRAVAKPIGIWSRPLDEGDSIIQDAKKRGLYFHPTILGRLAKP